MQAFYDENSNDFKGTRVIEHEILVGDAKPIRKPPYRTASRCYECSGIGHFARECPTRKKRLNASSPHTNKRARHGNASSRDAQVATVERQCSDKRSKLKKRRSRKRQTNQWKTEREAPVHAPPVKEANNKAYYDRKAKTATLK